MIVKKHFNNAKKLPFWSRWVSLNHHQRRPYRARRALRRSWISQFVFKKQIMLKDNLLNSLNCWQYSIKMNFEFLSGSLNYSVRPEWHKQRQLRLTYHNLPPFLKSTKRENTRRVSLNITWTAHIFVQSHSWNLQFDNIEYKIFQQ